MFGLCKGVSLDLYFPQFPTFRHISHTVIQYQLLDLFDTLHIEQVNDCNEDRYFTNQDYRCINILPHEETAHLEVYSIIKHSDILLFPDAVSC